MRLSLSNRDWRSCREERRSGKTDWDIVSEFAVFGGQKSKETSEVGCWGRGAYMLFAGTLRLPCQEKGAKYDTSGWVTQAVLR
jgi:hypothetical protein